MAFFDKITNIFTQENPQNIKNDDILITLGLLKENFYSNDISKLGYLDNYTEMLATRTSSMRTGENVSQYQPKNHTTRSIRSLSNSQKDSIKLAATLAGRENMFQACYGAPFSYLEAVDPYGRVYKDTFGFRREETWIGETTRAKSSNTDSKVFSAYIKVGMVAISQGVDLAEKSEKTVNALQKQTYKAASYAEETLGNSKNSEILKKKADSIKKSETNAEPVRFTSFSLSYFVTDKMLAENDYNKTIWEKGKIVPFNKFIRTALYRMLDMHTSPAISGFQWGDLYKDRKLAKDNEELRLELYKKIDSIYGPNTFPFFKFIASEETIVNETVSNMVGESFIKEKIDNSFLIPLAKELNFVSGGGSAIQVAGKFIDELNAAFNKFGVTAQNSAVNALKDYAKHAGQILNETVGTSIMNNILKGHSLIYPRVWKDSYIERMLSLQLRFYSPYGDFYSIFTQILMPLTTLLGMSLPRQIDPSFFTFPFVMSIEVPGLFNSEFAMITNITVTRGGRYDSWSEASIMRGLDITVDITALKPMFGLPEEVVMVPDKGGNGRKYSNEIFGDSKNSDKNKGDWTFANTLLNLSGSFTVSDQNITSEHIKILDEAFYNSDKNVNYKKFNFSTKSLQNSVSDLNKNLIIKNKNAISK